MRRPFRTLRAAAACTIAAALLSGCVLPAWGEDSYRGKAQTTASAAQSEVATAKLTVETLLRGSLQKAYADEVVSADEAALGSISDAFGSVQPPRASDELRSEVLDLVDEAGDAVADVRIAVRRGDRPALEAGVADLARLADDLGKLEERLR